MRCYVLMGVSGCGKTSVGHELAILCGMQFIDGDELHPAENIEKMSKGHALNDVDRAPWLTAVGQALFRTAGPVVIGCSALKKMYRDAIRKEAQERVHFLHLAAPRDVLMTRVGARQGHFMPPALLDSQFAALEKLDGDECGTEIDISQSFSAVVRQCETYVRETLR